MAIKCIYTKYGNTHPTSPGKDSLGGCLEGKKVSEKCQSGVLMSSGQCLDGLWNFNSTFWITMQLFLSMNSPPPPPGWENICNFLSKENIFCHRKQFPVTVTNFLSHEKISCHGKKFFTRNIFVV